MRSASSLMSTVGRFYATTADKKLVLSRVFCQQNMHAMTDGETSITMGRDAERGFSVKYQLSPAQYLSLIHI